jgi:hypothetical protein
MALPQPARANEELTRRERKRRRRLVAHPIARAATVTSWSFPIAWLYADARVARIYGGTSEVMKSIINKSLGL